MRRAGPQRRAVPRACADGRDRPDPRRRRDADVRPGTLRGRECASGLAAPRRRRHGGRDRGRHGHRSLPEDRAMGRSGLKHDAAPVGAWRPPSVDVVLRTPLASALADRYGRTATVGAIREAIAASRRHAGGGLGAEAFAHEAQALLEAGQAPRLKPVFNLTGTVLHTNLGRALLAEEAI